MIETIINMFSTASGGVSTLFDVFEKIKSLITTDPKEALEELDVANKKLIKLQTEFIKGHQLAMDLINENQKLSETLKQFETWDAEKENYKLVGISDGTYVYSQLKTKRGKQSPYYCLSCFNKNKLSLLTYHGEYKNAGFSCFQVLECDKCHKKVIFGEEEDLSFFTKAVDQLYGKRND